MSIQKTIQDLKQISLDLEGKGISVVPLADAIKSLEGQINNIEKVEGAISAIRSEIISPVRAEISTGHKLSRLGYYVGVLGLVLAAISVTYSFITAKNSEARFERLDRMMADAIFGIDSQSNFVVDEIPSNQIHATQGFSEYLNQIAARIARLETALIPAEQFETEPGSFSIAPFEFFSVNTIGGTTFRLSYSDSDFEIFSDKICGLFNIAIDGILIGNSGFLSGEKFKMVSEQVSPGTLSDRFSMSFQRIERDRVRLCKDETFQIFDTIFSIEAVEAENPLGRPSGDQRTQVTLNVEE